MTEPWKKYATVEEKPSNAPWERYAPDAHAEPRESLGMTLFEQGMQGATFGFADEISDRLGAAGAALLTGESYGDMLKQAREMTSERQARQWRQNPKTAIAGNIVGGLLTGGAGAQTRAGKAVADSLRSGKLAARIGKGAVAGAASGAAYGFGTGDDTADGRMQSALGSGVLGAVGGAVMPALASGVSAAVTKVRGTPEQRASRQVVNSFKSKAERFFAEQLTKRPDMAEALKKAEDLDSAAKALGIDLTTAEKLAYSSTDPLLAQQGIISSHPASGGRMAQFYASRSNQIEDAYSGVASRLSPQSPTYDMAARDVINAAGRQERAITKELMDQAQPLYDKAYTKFVPTDDEIFSDPVIRYAMQKAKANPVTGAAFRKLPFELPDNSVQALDLTKRHIDDMIEAAQRGGNRNEARILTNAKNRILAAADNAAPEYAEARMIYSSEPNKLRMRDRLGVLSDIDPADPKTVASKLMGGTEITARNAAQALGKGKNSAGAAIIRDAIETNRGAPESLVRRIAPNDRTAEQLGAYIGDEADNVTQINELARRVLMGNRLIRHPSPTQERTAAEALISNAAGAGADIATGNKIGLVKRMLSAITSGGKDDPQFYDDMYRLMTTDEGMELVKKVVGKKDQALVELMARQMRRRMLETNGVVTGNVSSQLEKR